MKLIKPSFEILTTMETISGMLQRIEKSGRVCYKSEDKITKGSAKKFIKMILDLGHLTVIEHEIMSVRIICDRGISHEIVRHRLASYSQESTRYCDYYDGHITFILPPWCRLLPGEYSKTTVAKNKGDSTWLATMLELEQTYKNLRAFDWSPQGARSILPNSLKTEITMTANLREWRHFFNLRCAKAAHPQMREIALPMLEAFCSQIPIIFDDLFTKFCGAHAEL